MNADAIIAHVNAQSRLYGNARQGGVGPKARQAGESIELYNELWMPQNPETALAFATLTPAGAGWLVTGWVPLERVAEIVPAGTALVPAEYARADADHDISRDQADADRPFLPAIDEAF